MIDISHEYIDNLRQTHPTLRLLNADHAPLIISFFYRVFIQANRRSIPYAELCSKLDDYLFQLQEMYGEAKYPRGAKAYIEDWLSENSEFMRQYYSSQTDEPEVDITPAAEKAIEWLRSLEQKQFIGAESRLQSLFQLLREVSYETEVDPALRIAELERQKAVLEKEIEKLRENEGISQDSRKIKERLLQANETARHLLSDFRQVEHNFRLLDRQARERIATSDEQKGKLLEIIFQEQDVIQNSDQGKSFKAFWEFLMSPTSQDELTSLLSNVLGLNEVKELNLLDALKQIDFSLLTAGEKVYRTSTLLAEQLRKYLESQAYQENRRLMDIIKKIEKHAFNIKDDIPKKKNFSMIDDLRPEIELIMSRSLFSAPKKAMIHSGLITEGKIDIELTPLYQQMFVNEAELLANIVNALQVYQQISFKELITMFPLQKGIEEVITYLSIASKDANAIIDNSQPECFFIKDKKVSMPKIIFMRNAS